VNGHTLALGLLGVRVCLLAIVWTTPPVRRWRQVRRFRKALEYIDVGAAFGVCRSSIDCRRCRPPKCRKRRERYGGVEPSI
jgi:hypothetical protein